MTMSALTCHLKPIPCLVEKLIHPIFQISIYRLKHRHWIDGSFPSQNLPTEGLLGPKPYKKAIAPHAPVNGFAVLRSAAAWR